MPIPEDQGYLHSLVGGLGGALMALGAWAWKHTHKRIDDIESGDNKMLRKSTFDEESKHRDGQVAEIKADIADHREHTEKAIDRITEVLDRTEVRFTVMDKHHNDRHIELLQAIHQIAAKK